MDVTHQEQNRKMKAILRRARKHVKLNYDCCDVPNQHIAYGKLLRDIDRALSERPTTRSAE